MAISPDVYDATRLARQAKALETRAHALNTEAAELTQEAADLRAEARRLAGGPLEIMSSATAGMLDAIAGPSDPFLGRIEAVLEGAGPLAMSDLCDHLNATPTRVRAALTRLESAGRVVKSGIKRGTRYRLAGDDSTPANLAAPFKSYEALVRNVAVRLGTFEFVDLQRELPDLSEATLRRWVRKLEDKGVLEVERQGAAKVYRPAPHKPGPTHRPRSEAPEIEAARLAGPMRQRGDVVSGTGRAMRAGTPIVDELLRQVRPYGVEIKRTSHKFVFMRNGQEIASCSSTPGASSLKQTRGKLRQAGVPV